MLFEHQFSDKYAHFLGSCLGVSFFSTKESTLQLLSSINFESPMDDKLVLGEAWQQIKCQVSLWPKEILSTSSKTILRGEYERVLTAIRYEVSQEPSCIQPQSVTLIMQMFVLNYIWPFAPPYFKCISEMIPWLSYIYKEGNESCFILQ